MQEGVTSITVNTSTTVEKSPKKRAKYKKRVPYELVETAVNLVVKRKMSIAQAEAITGASRYRIRKGLYTIGGYSIDMRYYDYNSPDKVERRKRVIETVNGPANGSFAEAARQMGMTRQRVYQIWKKYNGRQ